MGNDGRIKRRVAYLYIVLEGPIVSQEDMSGNRWTAQVFPTLHAISQSGRYTIVLISDQSITPAYSELLLDTLNHQGILVEQIVRKDDKLLIDTMLENTDTEHSYLIATDPNNYPLFSSLQLLPFTQWHAVRKSLLGDAERPSRVATMKRATKETNIFLLINLDGSGDGSISTGLPFFDHMLQQIARHARFDLTLRCDGDLAVDEHHTVEDVAIVLGQAIAKALGDKRGISRYGFEILPMDECLAQVALDFSGRSWFVWDVNFTREVVGSFPTELFSHFFKSFSDEAKCNLHMSVNSGNAHHQAEALFKAFARSLRLAVFRYPGNHDLPSTKGVL